MKKGLHRTSWKWLLAGLLAAGCGGAKTTGGENAARQPAPGEVEGAHWAAQRVDGTQPMAQALTLVSARRGASATVGGREVALTEGQSVTGATRVRAPGGAVFALGSASAPAGKLWLRPGAELALGQRDGAPVVGLVRGEARISLFASGEDVLVAGDARVRARSVAARPEDADWSLALEGEPAAATVGTLAARGLDGKPVELALAGLYVQAARAGDQVETEVEHVFDNTSDAVLEGTFRFPLPDGASLIGLSMEINGQMMQGELVERQQARKIFEEIVDQMQDPALLEWEEGQEFKLRVFPIEAHAKKRIILRYLSPLSPSPEGFRWMYSAGGRIANAASQKIGAVSVKWQGKVVAESHGALPGQDVVVEIPAREVAPAFREERPEGVYTSVRVTPDWSRIPAPGFKAGGRKLIIMVDSSRSALEERELTEDAVRALLGALRPQDEFMLTACDLGCRDHLGVPAPATAPAIAAAAGFVAGLEFDGASDLGAGLEHVATLRARWGETADVVYVGDGLPTWGDTEAPALGEHAQHAAGVGALHALVIGKGGSLELMKTLAGARGGRAMRPASALDARRFALAVVSASGGARLRSARVTAPAGSTLYPARETTLLPGDTLDVVMFTPKGQKVPAAVELLGSVGERSLSQKFAFASAEKARFVARRWGAQRVAELEATGGADADIIKTSLGFGVLSKKTAFLVLESEEAYAKYQIARKQKELADADGPRVTGQDLESSDDPDASLSPDHIQPGDPEVRVPAPRDARSVVVVFPFGETKVASWDDESAAWTVRFLIDKDTPDGEYFVTVRVTHADGTVETLRLPYHVDTTAPDMKITVEKGRRGAYVIRAVQQIPDLTRASVLTDARRVEVRLPDGQELVLGGIKLGEFKGTWKPAADVTGPVTLTVIVTDRALNQRVYEVPVAVDVK